MNHEQRTSPGDTANSILQERARRRRTLDVLGDLYLTDAGELSEPDSSLPPSVGASAAVVDPPPRPRPVVRSMSPASIRLAPKTRPQFPVGSRPVVAARTASVCEHPPQSSESRRQPTDSGQRDRRRPEDQANGEIEAVFLGNLPGFAGPWLMQYAQYVAERVGTVGVVRLGGDEIDVSVVSPGDHRVRAHDSGDASGRSVARWLVGLPATHARELSHARSGCDRWTLVCGADDTAVVGGYQLLKGLLGDDGDVADDDQDGDGLVRPSDLGMMVMGSEEEVSRVAAKKLNHTACNFLDSQIEFRGSLKRMMPVNEQALIERDLEHGDVWPQVRDAIADATEQIASSPCVDDSADPGAAAEDSLEHQRLDEQRDERDLLREPVIASFAEASRANRSSISAPIDRAEQEPRGGHRHARPETPTAVPPTDRLETPRPDPSALWSGDGELLAARCPRHPGVQLVMDSDGRVHLLHACVLADEEAVGQAASLREAMAELIEASRWAREHAQLIELTIPDRPAANTADRTTEPTCHLFTDQAKAAAALLPPWGHVVKVHLLQCARIGREVAWVSAELN